MICFFFSGLTNSKSVANLREPEEKDDKESYHSLCKCPEQWTFL